MQCWGFGIRSIGVWFVIEVFDKAGSVVDLLSAIVLSVLWERVSSRFISSVVVDLVSATILLLVVFSSSGWYT